MCLFSNLGLGLRLTRVICTNLGVTSAKIQHVVSRLTRAFRPETVEAEQGHATLDDGKNILAMRYIACWGCFACGFGGGSGSSIGTGIGIGHALKRQYHRGAGEDDIGCKEPHEYTRVFCGSENLDVVTPFGEQ